MLLAIELASRKGHSVMWSIETEDRRGGKTDRREWMNRCACHVHLDSGQAQPKFVERSGIPDRRLNSITVEEIYYDAALTEIMQ